MPVRPAKAADIPTMASVLAAAFGPDPMFQAIFPFQQQHPGHFERAVRDNLWLAWYDYRKVLMVSYEDKAGGGTRIERPADEQQALIPPVEWRRQTITGMAEWERAGRGSFHINGLWGRWDPRKSNPSSGRRLYYRSAALTSAPGRLIGSLLSTFYRIRGLVFPNKAAVRPTAEIPRPLTYWMLGPSLLPFTRQFMDAPHRETHWSLEILGVHPDFHGQGYGRELVEHGLRMSRSDSMGDLPACVTAAEGKENFYQKCGFKELVGYVSKAEDKEGRENPFRIHGLGGGAVLWTK